MTTHEPAQALSSAPNAAALAPALQANSNGWSRTFESLTNRNFRIFWIGMLFSFTGMQIGQVARQWLVYDLTQSSTSLGLVGALTSIPMLLFSLPGGVMADRVVKRNLLMVTQGATGVIAFALAALVMTQAIQVWHVMAAAVLNGFIFSFNAPGRQALISDLVEPERLLNAIALNSAGMNLTRVIAPVIAGLMVAGLGLTLTFYAYAAQYIVAVGILALLPAVAAASRPKSSAAEDLAEGFNYVRRDRMVLALMLYVTAPIIFAMPYQTLLPVMAQAQGVGSEGFGLMMGAVGGGALLGSLVVAWLGDYERKGLLMLGTGFLFGLLLVLFAYAPSFPLALLALALLGVCSTICMSSNNALVQTLAPEQMRGRVMGVYMITWGLSPLGSLPAGWLGDQIGVPLVLALGGAATSLVSFGMLLWHPQVRRL